MENGHTNETEQAQNAGIHQLTTAIAKEMSYAGGLQRQALFSIALVLFVFIMLINVVLNVVLKGGNRDE